MTTSSDPPATPPSVVNQDEQLPDENNARRRRGSGKNEQDAHHTRISAAWAAVVVAVALGIALVDFILQNTRSVKIEFFGANGRIPVAVALLAAALAGAVVVLIIGVCRTAQLRLTLRRKSAK